MMVLPARRAHVLGCGLAGSTWQLCDALKKVGAAVEAVLWRGIVDDENRCLRVKCADRAHSQLREVGIVGILDIRGKDEHCSGAAVQSVVPVVTARRWIGERGLTTDPLPVGFSLRCSRHADLRVVGTVPESCCTLACLAGKDVHACLAVVQSGLLCNGEDLHTLQDALQLMFPREMTCTDSCDTRLQATNHRFMQREQRLRHVL
mmetsp:Transcript_31905/g.74365  ORF Transcript_31905/g.74365 Transcript_31905/m.74365 type:complete len:205 (-) Transcript_31905:225-839(-)